jgi:hypothetical protein
MFLQEFLDAHLTFIVRDGRINQDRAATISELQDFIIANSSWLCETDLIYMLTGITARLLKANDEAIEVNQLKLENVFGMTDKVKDEVCIVEGKDG